MDEQNKMNLTINKQQIELNEFKNIKKIRDEYLDQK